MDVRILTPVAAAALLASVAVATPATASGGSDVVKRGSCSANATWKLKAGPEDGKIEVEAEVDSNKVGQTWRWRLVHNGNVFARGTRQTAGPSGSFEVRRVTGNAAGPDTIRLRAKQPASGQVCKGQLVL